MEKAGVERVCSLLGKGHAGVVFLVDWRGSAAALKVRRRDSRRETLEPEARAAALAALAGAGPEVYDFSEEYIVMAPVLGPSLEDLSEEGLLRPRHILAAIEAARALDTAGILHGELHRPWRSVLFTPSKAVIIDYDSASRGCGNVVKLVSGLSRRIPGILSLVRSERFRSLAKKYYWEGCGETTYIDIVEAVKKSLS
ncbi:serine/threonine protein kinase [Aeropyrum camini]|uniref:Predicted Ser/Thr protein kinase n=1 Tax=Aeropyrum camini SY1 = JCM 12091 TaxID=1198449 RepID=U3TEY3_9CREN|nr:serine/threonine protein kinase [Aeropyrum camini]BAN90590.1 predicted Ser/Thr protein kinase [Aeropyrum camini SY1 = JCM 12091]